MALQKYVQIECDQCGQCDHYAGGSIAEARAWVRAHGWITQQGKAFCDLECADKYGREPSQSIAAAIKNEIMSNDRSENPN